MRCCAAGEAEAEAAAAALEPAASRAGTVGGEPIGPAELAAGGRADNAEAPTAVAGAAAEDSLRSSPGDPEEEELEAGEADEGPAAAAATAASRLNDASGSCSARTSSSPGATTKDSTQHIEQPCGKHREADKQGVPSRLVMPSWTRTLSSTSLRCTAQESKEQHEEMLKQW